MQRHRDTDTPTESVSCQGDKNKVDTFPHQGRVFLDGIHAYFAGKQCLARDLCAGKTNQ